MRSFTRELEESFRGKHIRVTANERVYEGYARVFNFNNREVILYGATCDGKDLGRVAITDYDTIVEIDSLPIHEIDPSRIEESPYSIRSYTDDNLAPYVRTLRQHRGLFTFPLARTAPDTADAEYQLLSGHKQTEAARQAGFKTIPVQIIECSNWEALRIFVDEHIPIDENEQNDESRPNQGWYSREEITHSLEKMQEDWDEHEIRAIPTLQYWLTEQKVVESPDDTPINDEEGGDNGTDGFEEKQDSATDTQLSNAVQQPGIPVSSWFERIGALLKRIQSTEQAVQTHIEPVQKTVAPYWNLGILVYTITGYIAFAALLLAVIDSYEFWEEIVGPPALWMGVAVLLAVVAPILSIFDYLYKNEVDTVGITLVTIVGYAMIGLIIHSGIALLDLWVGQLGPLTWSFTPANLWARLAVGSLFLVVLGFPAVQLLSELSRVYKSKGPINSRSDSFIETHGPNISVGIAAAPASILWAMFVLSLYYPAERSDAAGAIESFTITGISIIGLFVILLIMTVFKRVIRYLLQQGWLEKLPGT